MNRRIWMKPFETREGFPVFPCPHCDYSTHIESFSTEETPDSKFCRGLRDWEHSQIEEHFLASARCIRPDPCGALRIIGVGENKSVKDEAGNSVWKMVYDARFVFPAPSMISMWPSVPGPVMGHIYASFSLYWNDAAAAANRLRSATEQLLTELGVKRFERRSGKAGPSKQRRLNISERIRILEATRPDTANHLDAIKWIGHSGSHADELSRIDVLDGLEILESVLDEIYRPKKPHIGQMVREITRRRKPRSIRRRSPEREHQ